MRKNEIKINRIIFIYLLNIILIFNIRHISKMKKLSNIYYYELINYLAT